MLPFYNTGGQQNLHTRNKNPSNVAAAVENNQSTTSSNFLKSKAPARICRQYWIVGVLFLLIIVCLFYFSHHSSEPVDEMATLLTTIEQEELAESEKELNKQTNDQPSVLPNALNDNLLSTLPTHIEDVEKEEKIPPPPIVKNVKTKQDEKQDAIFEEIAKLLTNPDQTSEGSYGWYREQLDKKNQLGNTKFVDPVMTKLGFQDTVTTSEALFHYFRTFNTTRECDRQHKCKIYADKTAGQVIEEGTPLDAVLVHCFYRPPFFLNSHEEESKHLKVFHHLITKSKKDLKQVSESRGKKYTDLTHSDQVDKVYGEKMWRGMRRLLLLMCSEAVIISQLKYLTQKQDDYMSMERFAESPADVSICFLSTCSVWVNYQYWKISLSKSKKFGKNSFKGNKGICAFISNCDRGGYQLKERYELLVNISKYIPVKQYGKCGKNSVEGPGGKIFELENNCRFYYAGENSIVNDYVTEKFFEGLRALQNGAKMLMVYRGAPNLRQDWGFPKIAHIDHTDFSSPEKLGQYLKKLNDDDNAFEERFNRINMKEREKIDNAIDGFDYRLGSNIPCRICSIIGDMKLARYLLFKIGLKPKKAKVSWHEWNQFKVDKFENLSDKRLEILDKIYHMAYNIFQFENNKKNKYNLGWNFDKK